MEDVQQYLTGKMNEADRQRFEKRVESEPQLRAELDVHIGLNQLKTEKKVKEAITMSQQKQTLRRVIIGIALLLVAGAAAYFLMQKPKSSSADESPEMEKQEGGNPERGPRDGAEGGKSMELEASGSGAPMAERKVKFTEKHLMRGVYTDLDADTREVLDILLVRTQKTVYDAPDQVAWRRVIQDFASGQLETVRATALQLEKQHPTQTEWVLALTLLAQGKVDDAQAAFKKISQNASHPQRENALWALEKLR